MSHATQIKEFNRSVGKLQYSIQIIQGTVSRRAGTSLSLEVLAKQEAWAPDQPMPTTAEEMQEVINTTMSTLHTTSKEWREITDINDESVKWDDIQDYVIFCQVFHVGSYRAAPLSGKTRSS